MSERSHAYSYNVFSFGARNILGNSVSPAIGCARRSGAKQPDVPDSGYRD